MSKSGSYFTILCKKCKNEIVRTDDPSGGEATRLVTSSAKIPMTCEACGHSDRYSQLDAILRTDA
jgi:RNase P subunit RPR2